MLSNHVSRDTREGAFGLSRIGDYASMKKKRSLYFLSVVSGTLIALSMPNYNLWLLAWVGLIPMYAAIDGKHLSFNQKQWISFPGTLIWSIAVHNWYPAIMGWPVGLILMVAVGMFFAAVIALGKTIEESVSWRIRVFALPIVWSALEWIRYVAPVTKDWWFVLLPKSQWNNEAALQTLAWGGFPLLSFLIVLVNVSLARMLLTTMKRERIRLAEPSGLAVVAIVLILANLMGVQQQPSDRTIKVAAISDMITQNESIVKLAQSEKAGDGYVADSEPMMQAIFDVNAGMTRDIVKKDKPQFVVWSENEFTNYENEKLMSQVKELAKELDIYLVVDVVWNHETGMHDTALMIGPDGNEVGKRAKIQMTDGELEYGFTAGDYSFEVFETRYGKVGIAVCWDKHRTDIVRKLAQNGADLILIPDDNDFNGNANFLLYASTDSIFRAVENGVAVSSASVSGQSMVVEPNGRIAAMTGGNTQAVASSAVFLTEQRTWFNQLGNWFAVLECVLFGLLAVMALSRRKEAKIIPHESRISL
jgi:apolipoprotein N-acyltransferase